MKRKQKNDEETESIKKVVTNEYLLNMINDLSEGKLSSDVKIYSSIDTKASWIILFLGTVIAILFNSEMKLIYVIVGIVFTLSIAFSIVVIRPRDLRLGVNLYGLTKKYWDKNKSEYDFFENKNQKYGGRNGPDGFGFIWVEGGGKEDCFRWVNGKSNGYDKFLFYK